MESQKCAHEACECIVEKGGRFGKYCSEHCKDAAGLTELRCHCQHPECAQASARHDQRPGEGALS